jgi:hypothetical protein
MSDQLNWFIVPSDNSVTKVLPGETTAIIFFDETVLQRVVYRSGEYGINLDWDDPDQATRRPAFCP